MNATARLLAALSAVILAVTPATADESAPAKTLRLLTVGNSFADNMLRFLPDLAAAAGRNLVIGRANFTGCSLEKHWQAVETGEAIYPTGKDRPRRSLREALEADRWDVISIQQASRLSDDWTTYQPHAAKLVEFIRHRAPQAEVVIHQTWAYRWDDPKFGDGSTPAKMHAAVRDNYHRLARELGLRIVPVGEAFHLASSLPEWSYRKDETFDFKTPPKDAVPSQPGSLHAGWGWARPPGSNTPLRLRLDAHHANIFGAYLGGCVMLQFLTGLSPEGNTFVPDGMTRAQAASLQAIAARAASPSEIHTTTP